MDRTRASDSERERVVTMVRDAAIAGRLTVEELDARCERAYAAMTRGDLAVLLEDLPAGASKPDPALAQPAQVVVAPQHRWTGPSPWMAGARSPSSAPICAATSASISSLTISATLSRKTSTCSERISCSTAPWAVVILWPSAIVMLLLHRIPGRNRRF
jgi:hypothetical protein